MDESVLNAQMVSFRKVKQNELVIFNPYKRTQFNNKSYEGKIFLKIDEKTNTLMVINNVELETYIYSVLRSESIPYWPLEMHKIQAIASRSYCYYLINAQRPRSGLYDLKNSNFNQLYNGHHQFKTFTPSS
jgi:peptidoglycan hydrolase-like amidase